MKQYIGIDAGGSNFRIAVIDSNKNLIYHKSIKGNLNFTSAGSKNISDCFKKINIDFKDVDSVSIAMAGIGAGDQKNELKKIIFNNLEKCQSVNIFTDAEGSLYANFPNSSGILIICGTGSIVLGKNENKISRAGGWGYLLDDEGSGFWFSKEIIMEYLRYVDGISNNKEIFGIVDKKFSLPPREIITDFYNPEKRNIVASLSNDFLKEKNTYIQELIKKSIFNNIQRIKKVINEIEIKEPTLAYMGGIFKNNDFLSSFKEKIKSEIKDLKLIEGIKKIEIQLAKNALRNRRKI